MWDITPNFILPKGYKLKEDTEFLYIYKGESRQAILNINTVTPKTILAAIKEA